MRRLNTGIRFFVLGPSLAPTACRCGESSGLRTAEQESHEESERERATVDGGAVKPRRGRCLVPPQSHLDPTTPQGSWLWEYQRPLLYPIPQRYRLAEHRAMLVRRGKTTAPFQPPADCSFLSRPNGHFSGPSMDLAWHAHTPYQYPYQYYSTECGILPLFGSAHGPGKVPLGA